MIGMSATDGKALSGTAHLAQSIADILSTPIGTRVMRRDYGSMLFELIDRPINGATRMLIHAATAVALRRWEPRLRLTRVVLSGDAATGSLAVAIEGVSTETVGSNALVSLSIPLRREAAAS